MISGVGQLDEVRAHGGPGDLAVPGDDVAAFCDRDLTGREGLGASLAAQGGFAGSAEIPDPVGLAIR